VVCRNPAGNHYWVVVLCHSAVWAEPQLGRIVMNDGDEGEEMATIFLVGFLIVLAVAGFAAAWLKLDA
jgi:uncharacterized membrane protein YhaH (DUF805 family)